MKLLYAAAASTEKSGEQAIPLQVFTPAVVQEDQLTPPSTVKRMLVPMAVAANLVKSGVEAIPYHCSFPAPVMAVQTAPPLLDK